MFHLFARLRQDGTTEHAAPAAIGMKVAYGNEEEAADLANAVRELLPGLRVIHVVRSNLVAQLGSLRLAQETGTWHAWRGEATMAGTKKITIGDREFREYVRGAKASRAHISSLQATNPILPFFYEEDIAPGLNAGKLFAFLGIEQIAPDGSTCARPRHLRTRSSRTTKTCPTSNPRSGDLRGKKLVQPR